MTDGSASSQSAPDTQPAWPWLLAIWALVTVINVGKAAHIDDTAHLEVARWILDNPLHPMQGVVSWQVHPAPIHELNQPHLFFYLIAAVMALVGPTPLAGQLVVAAFSALAIACYHALHRLVVGARGAVIATALLFVSPAFIPGQNLMTDAPLLALWLAFFLALASARGPRAARYLVLAALLCGLACLVKYTSLVLLPALALDAWLRRKPRALGLLLIPLAMLAAWSAFNVWDYGGVHIFERPIASAEFSLLERFGITMGRAALWVLTLGALTPFTLALVPALRGSATGRRWVWIALGAIAVLALATRPIVWWGPERMQGETVLHSVLRAAFFVQGVLVISLSVRAYRGRAVQDEHDARVHAHLGAWALGVALFVIVLSPFVAVRHVLLALPPLLLLLARAHRVTLLEPRSRGWVAAALATTAALGVALGVSDRAWAAVYREEAAHHRAAYVTPDPHGPERQATYFVGHWGWQWYASEAGLLAYDPGSTELRVGDTLVVPLYVDHPPLDEAVGARLSLQESREVPATFPTTLRTTTSRLGYYSVWEGLPWTVDLEPLEVFHVYRVVR